MSARTSAPARTARRAQSSGPVEALARLGLFSRGVIWLTIGLLCLALAVGHAAQADRQGAMQTLARQPFGKLLLLVLVVGFLGYGGWRLLMAAVGHTEQRDERRRWAQRFASLCRAVLYLGFAVSTVTFLLHGSKADNTAPLTARVMGHGSPGRWLVGLVGVGVVVGGLVLAATGVRGTFMDRLERGRVRWPRAVSVVGAVGLAGRGLVVALVGVFLVRAALTFDAHASKGLDASLKSLQGQAFGHVLLAVAAVGLLAFGVWSFAEAAWRRI